MHFLVLFSVVPLVELFDSFNTDLLLGISFILYSNFTFLIFVTISVIIKKENIKRLPSLPYTRKWLQIRLRNYTEVPFNEIEESHREKWCAIFNMFVCATFKTAHLSVPFFPTI